MPRCIASGCTSGYDTNNEKVHFFHVPKDENLMKLWQIAIKRKNFNINHKQSICDKHFLPTDILWNHTIYNKQGNILGVVKKVQIIGQKEDLFDKPVSNIYIKYVNGNIKFLIFFLPKYNLINDHENKYTFNAVKEVVLTKNMKLEVTVLKQPIIHILSDMQIHNTIENIEQLKESLFSVDNFNICLGAINIANDIEHLGYNLAFKDICNTWRHNKCLLLIPQSSKTCKFCLNIKSSLNKKKAYKSSQSS
ncbi:hypothetical protein ALC57_14164 [Trachymyrmex cornetzi]|uniref:THAP-type domain-containing protein n=1 Tax=Trachymyrmex cornetzi TaxID=471704 RepID=A0A151IYK4_9HYME|nr:hypothetical protein ALC57_14164 [Trachymyrmex cornetzi]